jgi:hypothetical protein
MRPRPLLLGLVLTATHCSRSSSTSTTDASAAVVPAAPAAAPAAAVELARLPEALAHPCTLLDRADIEAALGTGNFTPEETPCKQPAGGGGCTWHVPKGGGFAEVLLRHPSNRADFERLMVEMGRTPLDGLGDRAYVAPKMKWGHVDVVKNGQVFMVQVSRGNVATGMTAGHDSMQEATLTLARKVASKF